jgi:hypothetical protein
MRKKDESDEMAEALLRLEFKYGVFKMELDLGTTVGLVATVQLALRHPSNRGATAGKMRDVCDSIIAALGQTEPRLAELLRRGYDPDFDVLP